jgi:hypothetical protein
MIAVGTDIGEIFIWEISSVEEKPFELLRTLPSLRVKGASPAIRSCEWGLSNTQLVVIDESEALVVWDISRVRRLRQSSTTGNSGTRKCVLYPMDFYRILQASEATTDPVLSTERKNELLPTYSCFHTSINFAAKHSSIVVALRGGSLVKWNMHDASTKNKSMVFGALPTLPNESPLPSSTKSRLEQFSLKEVAECILSLLCGLFILYFKAAHKILTVCRMTMET